MDMQQQPIEPHRPMTVQLTAEQWNAVIYVMREHPLPYKVSAPIIDHLGQQLQRQSMPQAPRFSTEASSAKATQSGATRVEGEPANCVAERVTSDGT